MTLVEKINHVESLFRDSKYREAAEYVAREIGVTLKVYYLRSELTELQGF